MIESTVITIQERISNTKDILLNINQALKKIDQSIERLNEVNKRIKIELVEDAYNLLTNSRNHLLKSSKYLENALARDLKEIETLAKSI